MLVDASQLNILAVDLGAAAPRVIAGAQRQTLQSTLDIEGTAKVFAPVRTGTLMRSIHHEIAPSGLEAEIGTDVEYAPFVEYGTSRMAPQAYMRPAFDQHVGGYINGLADVLDKAVFGG